ncbi:hypothetical protein ACHAWF_011164 [Thalassiosira exigua]
MTPPLLALAALALSRGCDAFSPSGAVPSRACRPVALSFSASRARSDDRPHPRRVRAHGRFRPLFATYAPVFDFSAPGSEVKSRSASSFERIDDAIMGGISQSSLRDVPSEPYASWSGVCRTDGGGFCGTRTFPFVSPLNATGCDGVYLDCRLASDDDADRRVWKLTVRTDTSRGERVYQAEYDLKGAMENTMKREGGDDRTWARVKVPFEEFRLVRGPRLVPDGPPLDASGGIYQIGMTLSKFQMAENTTEIENFRPGYFDVHIQRMGFYGDEDVGIPTEGTPSDVPETLSKEDASKKRPLLLKLLLPVAKVFFSEQANRRRSAMRILREERGLNRAGAISFGARWRRGSMGLVPSVAKTLGILSVDSFRAVTLFVLRLVVVYPLRVFGAFVRMVKRMLGMRVQPSLRE